MPPTWLVSASYSAQHFFTDVTFLNKISLDWLLTLNTQPSTSKLSDNPDDVTINLFVLKVVVALWLTVRYFSLAVCMLTFRV